MSFWKHSFTFASGLLFVPSGALTRAPNQRTIKRWVAPTLKELKRRQSQVGVQPEKPRSSYLEWNYEAELFAFGKRLGEDFKRDILKRALIQTEYANLLEFNQKEKGEISEAVHNHDLVKEGESIISTYIAEEYSKLYPEDVVKAVQKYLMSKEMLSHVARHLGLKDLILAKEYPPENQTMSDTFKAVVAALKQSQSLERANFFVNDFLLSQMNGKDLFDIWSPENPFDYLLNILQGKGIKEVEPRLCNQSATNTILANYQVGLYSDKKLLGIGWGENIKTAKDMAALDAIQKVYKQHCTKKV
ncbi:large ribosomal subunit protein mL44 [Cylas formicarius]|uniref:large ribosomal subunit protein mL44 n=1 Tax=Cylas formicarius TaxID=197179 RepID=UPI00295845B7|nr:large ribosomal subunit protein mL44 [Cylas formicarius]